MNKSPTQLKDSWRLVAFGDMVKNVAEAERAPLAVGLERYLGLEHLEPGDLHIRRWGDLAADEVSFTRRFRKGQVLFAKRRAYQRKVAVAEFDGVCSSDILCFEPKDPKALLPELLPFICQTDAFFDHALGTSAGSLSPRTRWRQLKTFQFPLPPIDQQKRIAELLWAAEAAIEKYSDVTVTSWRLRSRLLDKMIPEPEKESGSYRVVQLHEVCEMQNGRSFPSKDYCDEGVRLIRPGNLARDGAFNWAGSATTFLPKDYRQRAADFLVGPAEVIMNLTAQSLEEGFIGRVCMTGPNDNGLLNQRLGRFRCRPNMAPEYLFRLLQTSRFRRLVESRCEGSKIRHTYFRHFSSMPLSLLPLAEQRDIVDKIAAAETAAKSARLALEMIRNVLQVVRESQLGQCAHVERR